jgi:CheY-like chemotaxis protein
VKVFVIEDDLLKERSLVNFISVEYPEVETKVFRSFRSGLSAIQASLPSLVLLDMTLPTYDRSPGTREGRLRPLGGYDLMRKVLRLNLRPIMIVVTQLESFGDGQNQVSFREITARCEREFPAFFGGSVYYHPTSSSWGVELRAALTAAIERVRKDGENSPS